MRLAGWLLSMALVACSQTPSGNGSSTAAGSGSGSTSGGANSSGSASHSSSATTPGTSRSGTTTGTSATSGSTTGGSTTVTTSGDTTASSGSSGSGGEVPADHRPVAVACDAGIGIGGNQCGQDSDCADGGVCLCDVSQIPLSGSSNVCYPAGCRVDADCGPGGYCSPSPTLGCCGGPSGFHCHTPQDSCLNDSDCADGGLFCLFVQTAWHCGTPQMCGC